MYIHPLARKTDLNGSKSAKAVRIIDLGRAAELKVDTHNMSDNKLGAIWESGIGCSFRAPPFWAQVARSSAALFPSSPECPLTLTQVISAFLFVAACISLRHTIITVSF